MILNKYVNLKNYENTISKMIGEIKINVNIHLRKKYKVAKIIQITCQKIRKNRLFRSIILR